MRTTQLCYLLFTKETERMKNYFEETLSVKEKKAVAMSKNGLRVKEIRTQNKLTQSQLIEMLEIRGGKTLISNVEHGKRSLPAAVLPIIADMGETTVETFFSDTNTMVYDDDFLHSCLVTMGYDDEDTKTIKDSIGRMVTQAKSKIGEARLFDLIFMVIKIAAEKRNVIGSIADEIYMLDGSNYGNNQSRYKRYINDILLNKKQ